VIRDHVHLVVTVTPKVSISELMGFLKGKTAIGIFKQYTHLRRKPYWRNHFWSRGYCVTTLGTDEEKIKRYVKYQEDAERLEEKEREEPGLF
jgi:putative transposase